MTAIAREDTTTTRHIPYGNTQQQVEDTIFGRPHIAQSKIRISDRSAHVKTTNSMFNGSTRVDMTPHGIALDRFVIGSTDNSFALRTCARFPDTSTAIDKVREATAVLVGGDGS
mmetsp:Transcript_35810/g.57897  ORF Transcript_35810/g.57897 Transcript_35810/m.57897 type:complete len:114 (-) Transcript_35810:3695-4036(-)